MQKLNNLLRVPTGLLLFIPNSLESSSTFLHTTEGAKYLAELQRIEDGIMSLSGKGLDKLSASEKNLLSFYNRRQHELTERIGAQLPFPSPTAHA